MKYFVRVGETEHEVTLDGDTLTLDGRRETVRLDALDGTPVQLLTVGSDVHRILVRREAGRGAYEVAIDGYRVRVEAVDERTRAINALAGVSRQAGGTPRLTAPMPGLIVRVAVREGEEVHAGQGVIVMEAMKMENELRVQSPGIVKRVHVAPGSAVERGALLIELA